VTFSSLFAWEFTMSNRLAKLVSAAALCLAAVGADWPAFRGPSNLGVSDEQGLPVKWTATDNVLWKVKLPGPGSSSPIIWGDKVFVTCWSGYGEGKGKKGDVKDLRRHLLCLDRKTGMTLWQKDVAAKLPELEYKTQVTQHGYATSTPVTDGERVYVYFGRTGALAFDMDGKELWHSELGKALNTFGTGGSPTLYKDLLIVNATVEGGALIALDKKTGKEVWKAKGLGDCWSTPVIVNLPNGKQEVVLNGPAALTGFDPANGKQLWECELITTAYASSTPLVKSDVIYVMNGGSGKRQFLAVRAGGKDDVTKTHILWQQEVGASYCSPVLVGDRLYFISGGVTCLKADTGDIVFQERLAGVGQEYGSPIAAEGKIVVFTRFQGAYVLAAKDKLEVIARNDLGDTSAFNASPAVSKGQLFIRSHENLYCLGQKK
jgi:hypothetical protein